VPEAGVECGVRSRPGCCPGLVRRRARRSSGCLLSRAWIGTARALDPFRLISQPSARGRHGEERLARHDGQPRGSETGRTPTWESCPGGLLFAVQNEAVRRTRREGPSRTSRPRQRGRCWPTWTPRVSGRPSCPACPGSTNRVVGTMVDELENLGYVQRRPDPADRRREAGLPDREGPAADARRRPDHGGHPAGGTPSGWGRRPYDQVQAGAGGT